MMPNLSTFDTLPGSNMDTFLKNNINLGPLVADMVPDTPRAPKKYNWGSILAPFWIHFLNNFKTFFGNITCSHLPENEARSITNYDQKTNKMTAVASALNST